MRSGLHKQRFNSRLALDRFGKLLRLWYRTVDNDDSSNTMVDENY